MTDQEKLNRLFQAALKDSSEISKAPTRLFPTSPATDAAPAPVPPPAVIATAPEPAMQPVMEVASPENDLVKPMENAGLSEEESAELGKLLDEQIKRKKRQRRRELVITLLVCFGMTGGGFGWFVSSPERVQAFKDVMRDIRRTGDIKSMVDSYKKSLERISARGQQIDQATAVMGAKASANDNKDIYFEEEMKDMMGPDAKGKTVGSRAKALEKSFGDMRAKAGVDPNKEPVAKVSEEESFKWE